MRMVFLFICGMLVTVPALAASKRNTLKVTCHTIGGYQAFRFFGPSDTEAYDLVTGQVFQDAEGTLDLLAELECEEDGSEILCYTDGPSINGNNVAVRLKRNGTAKFFTLSSLNEEEFLTNLRCKKATDQT